MPDKLKRPPTSGTRKGNGAGYGGSAKGAGSAKSKQDFGPGTNVQGHNATTTVEQGNRAELRRQQADDLMDQLHAIAVDVTRGPSQVKAIETFQNRVWGMPKATVDATVRRSLTDFSDEELALLASCSGSDEGVEGEGSGSE